MAGKESKRIHLTKQRTMTKKRKYSIFLSWEGGASMKYTEILIDLMFEGGLKHKKINTNGWKGLTITQFII
jgi:hypothetical protein